MPIRVPKVQVVEDEEKEEVEEEKVNLFRSLLVGVSVGEKGTRN